MTEAKNITMDVKRRGEIAALILSVIFTEKVDFFEDFTLRDIREMSQEAGVTCDDLLMFVQKKTYKQKVYTIKQAEIALAILKILAKIESLGRPSVTTEDINKVSDLIKISAEEVKLFYQLLIKDIKK